MSGDFKYLKHRRATEQETYEFYRERRRTMQIADSRGLRGKERFAFVCERAKTFPFYYSTQLNCVMFVPSDDQVFRHWCRHHDIPSEQMEFARKIWDAGIAFWRESNYDEETLEEHRKGVDRLRLMKQDAIREQRAEHERRYSES